MMTIIISFQNFVLPTKTDVHIKISAIFRAILTSKLSVSSYIKLSIDKKSVDLFCVSLIKLRRKCVNFLLSTCSNINRLRDNPPKVRLKS